MSWADKGPLCQSLEGISASPLMFLPPHSPIAHYDSHSDRGPLLMISLSLMLAALHPRRVLFCLQKLQKEHATQVFLCSEVQENFRS